MEVPGRAASARLADAGARQEPLRPRRGVPRELLRNGVHLAVLTAFAVAQPLYDVLGENAEFFAVRDATATEIVAFACLLALGPVLVLLAVEALASLAGPRALRGVHLAAVAALAGLIAVQFVKHTLEPSGPLVVAIVLVLVALLVVLYVRVEAVGSFLTLLAPAPFVFLALFLFHSPVEQLVVRHPPAVELASNVHARIPVVLVIFDEFPLTSLLREDGTVNAARYPNFAALSHDAYWFRNTSTVDESTTEAVPAILTGLYSAPSRRLPIYDVHPHNLFALLGGAYRLNVWESQTTLCPPTLCRDRPSRGPLAARLRSLFADAGVVYAHVVTPDDYEESLPSVSGSWGGFLSDGDTAQAASGQVDGADTRGGGLEAYHRFVASIGPSRRPTLHFFHAMLPHASWVRTPSCRRAAAHGRSAGLDRGAVWADDEGLAREALARHLLQVGCVDRLLGELVARLRETGLYDRSLLIVVSDHGVSVRPGQPRRAVVPETNLEDIAYVPLFVKIPGRGAGTIDAHRESVDIVPTIADVLGITIPWHVDGRSLLAKHRLPNLHLMTKHGLVDTPAAPLLARRDEAVKRIVDIFGSGPWSRMFAAGPYAALVGRPVATERVVDGDGWGWITPGVAELVRSLPADPPLVPTPITGVLGLGTMPPLPLAVAVNGTIRAVVSPYARNGGVAFTANVPESSFRPGANKVELFSVEGPPNAVTLHKLSVPS
jgi:hypothetical protein